jgi:hypothetical protein
METTKARLAHRLEKAVVEFIQEHEEVIEGDRYDSVDSTIDDIRLSDVYIPTLRHVVRDFRLVKDIHDRLLYRKRDLYRIRLDQTYVGRFANGKIYCPEGCAPPDDQSELLTAKEAMEEPSGKWPRHCQKCGQNLSEYIPKPE